MKKENLFVEGAISPSFIAECLQKHQSKTTIGAHSLFLGQIREDRVGERSVEAITYTTYKEMALETMTKIREELFKKYDLVCMHVYHSLGMVRKGEISLFVFTSSKHRKSAIDACEEMVERVKKELPIWGKEELDDQTHLWKENN